MTKKDIPAVISGMGVGSAILGSLVKKVLQRGGTEESIHRLSTPEGKPLLDQIADLIAQNSWPKIVWFEVELDDDTPVEGKNGPHFNLGFNTNLTAANFPNPRAGQGKKKVKAAMVYFGEYIEERSEVERCTRALELRPGNASELADTSVSNPDSEELAACLPAAAIDEVWESPSGHRYVACLNGSAAKRKLDLNVERHWGDRWWFLAFPVE